MPTLLYRILANIIYDLCFSDAKEYADEINAIFTETSALTAINIKELFEKIGK